MADRSPEAIKKLLMEDPNTAKLAEALKLPLEDYIQLVTLYATTGEKPQFFVVSDEDLRKMGHEPPDPKKMAAYLTEAVNTIVAREGTAFTAKEKKPVSLGETPAAPAPTAVSNPDLKAELDAQLRGKRGGKT